MFTGIVEETGIIKVIHHGSVDSFIKIQADKIFEDICDSKAY